MSGEFLVNQIIMGDQYILKIILFQNIFVPKKLDVRPKLIWSSIILKD